MATATCSANCQVITISIQVTFISDDIELRTRTRAIAGGQPELKIYNGDSLIPGARSYCALKGKSIDDSPIETFYEEIAQDKEDSN